VALSSGGLRQQYMVEDAELQMDEIDLSRSAAAQDGYGGMQ
jgi:hypothetical protein